MRRFASRPPAECPAGAHLGRAGALAALGASALALAGCGTPGAPRAAAEETLEGLRVEVSDARSNAVDEGLDASDVSVPFTIDNTPPVTSSLTATGDAGAIRLEGRADTDPPPLGALLHQRRQSVEPLGASRHRAPPVEPLREPRVRRQ